MYPFTFGLELSHQVGRTAPLQQHENDSSAPKDGITLATGMEGRCTPDVSRILLYTLMGKPMACSFSFLQIRAS